MNEVGIIDKIGKAVTKGLFNFAQSIEDTVGDVIFSKMIPEQLDWIEFRAVRRQKEQPQGVGYPKLVGVMPPSAVHKQEAEVTPELLRRVSEED